MSDAPHKHDARWDNIKRLFNAAMERPQSDRPAFLDAGCEGDAALRREVESLLLAARQHHDSSPIQTGGAARALANATTSSQAFLPLTEKAGSIIGPYKLLQIIGEGGFGTVFMADQSSPVRRRVALKIIKLGMDTKAVVARFEAERQALALMDHPHIAKVLDGGATPLTAEGGPAGEIITGGGRPYFVMEYVTGDPITTFAIAHKLTIKDRLALFEQVCQAVQHAHHKGVIHRDIKPGNVLVSMTDGKPFAKVIDFGIAKATAQPLTEKTLFTEHRQLIGTPEYMSPEQAEGSADIDTRTDVYALGVLLYELLTGLTPFDGKRLRSAAYGEMQRIIKEEEPPMPSVRLSRAALGAPASGGTGVPPVSLSSLAPVVHTAAPTAAQVKGELDWIVMKALDKDRARRYDTPSALAADVQRHIAGDAVVAAPPSAGYRLRKFVRRNKGAVVTVSAVMLALAAGGGVAAWQWSRAQQQSTRAEAENKKSQDLTQSLERDRAKVAESVSLFTQSILAQTGQLMIMSEGDKTMELSTMDPEDSSKTLSVRIIRGATPEASRVVGLNAERQEVPITISQSVFALNTLTSVTLSGLRFQTDDAQWSAYTANLALAQQSIINDAYPRARQLLSEIAPRLRGWEWTFLSRRADTVNFVLPETRFFATYVKPGKTILANGYTNAPIIVDSTVDDGGRTISRLPGAGSLVTHGVVSPDRRFVALAGLTDGETVLRVWQVDDAGQAQQVFSSAGRQQVSGLAFSSSGRYLASIDTHASVRIFDAHTGALVHEFSATTRDRGLYSLQFSPDGQRLFVSGSVLAVFDLRKGPPSGTTLRSWTGSWVAEGHLSADGKLFATSYADEHQFQVWPVDSDSLTPTNVAFDPGAGSITTLGFDPRSGQLLTAHRSGEIRIWSVEGDVVTAIGTFRGHHQQVEAIELPSKGGTVISSDLSGNVIEWGNDPSFAGYLKPLRSIAVGGSISNLEFSSSPSGMPELLINSCAGEQGRGRGLVVVPLHGADPISKPGESEMQLQIDVAIGPGKLVVPRFDAYEPARAIGPLSVPTADGTRTMRVRNSRELVITRSADAKELSVFTMPNDIIGLALSSDDKRLAIVMHEAGQGVSAQIWDIRDPEERRKDLQAEWTERVPAGAYLDTLWNAAPDSPQWRPAASLRETIIADASLTPLRRLVAVELLEERTQDTQAEADRAFAEMTKDQTDAGVVQVQAQAAELPPRVKELVVASAKAWTYTPPVVSEAEKLATETTKRELAEADAKRLGEALVAEADRWIRELRTGPGGPVVPSVHADSRFDAAARMYATVYGEAYPKTLELQAWSKLTQLNDGDEWVADLSAVENAVERYRAVGDAGTSDRMTYFLANAIIPRFQLSMSWLDRLPPGSELADDGTRWNHKTLCADIMFGRLANPSSQPVTAAILGDMIADCKAMIAFETPLWWSQAEAFQTLSLAYLRANEFPNAMDFLQQSMDVKAVAERERKPSGPRYSLGTPVQFTMNALIRFRLASADDAVLAAAAEIDGKPGSLTNGKVLTRDEHRAAAREALAKASTLMAAPPMPPAPGSPQDTLPPPNPWADDADAKALLAEAEALIEGKKP